MQVVFDYSHPRGYVDRVVLDDGSVWQLQGECNLCGACCEADQAPPRYRQADGSCSQLISETRNGVAVKVCGDFWNRPMSCAIYPKDPHEALPEPCGYSWIRVA